jgi:competence protein ComEC
MMTGIVIQYYFEFSLMTVVLNLLINSILFFLFYKLPLHYRYRFQRLQSAFLIVMIISFGMMLTRHQDLRNSNSFFLDYYQKGDELLLRIDAPLTEKQNSFTTTATVHSVIKNKSLLPVKGKLNLTFKKNDTAKNLRYGDLIIIKKSAQSIKNFGNPGEFDNKRYNAFQQTYHQLYLKGNDFKCCNENKGNLLFKTIYALKEKTLIILQNNISNQNGSLGIAEALLIGYKNDLDKEMVQAYSNTGVVHIIAISGLHLGLIYMVLFWLLERMPLVKRNRFVKAIILLSCLWMFSLMTGASASVLRSAVMFTCIIIGNMLNRKSSIYNSLAASAFLLLCYNPYFLWDVGFQLSYFAIIGIVWLQKPIQQLLTFSNYILRKIWEMTSITIAAQIITFPICLFYFHQFPTYFLLSNLVAVPLSTIILFEEIALLCCSGFHSIALFMGKIVETSITLMNNWILIVNKFPRAVIDFIYADMQTTLLLYAVVIMVVFFLLLKKKSYLQWSLLLLTLFSSLQSMAKFKWKHQRFFIVYHLPRNNCIDFVDGEKYQSIADSDFLQNNAALRFYVEPSRKSFRVKPKSLTPIKIGNNNLMLNFHGKRIAVVNTIIKTNTPVNVDYLVLTGNPKMNIRDLADKFKFQKIIFTASNSLWKIDKWKKECDSLHLHCFSVQDDGAFVVKIKNQ